MPRLSLRFAGSAIGLLLCCHTAVGCDQFDSTPRESSRGTLGAEIYKVVCERMAIDVYPTDVTGNKTRALCRGEAAQDSVPESRLRALAANRDRLIEALDQMLPAELEDELQTLLLSMIPFYDPPIELLPNNTRAIGALLSDLMVNEDATQALGRISHRRGLRPQQNALGLARPILSYDGLTDLAKSVLAVVNDGGALEPEWSHMLEAGALEMATAAPAEPDSRSLELTRQLLFAEHESFGTETPRYVVARDSRGLPLPALLDGTQGFVDLDTDGLADTDELGRFLAADGSLLNPPTPFAIIGESGVSRDEAGRALTAEGDPLYVYQNIERSLLAALVREAPALFNPNDPILVDLIYGLVPMLGAEAAREETYGEHDLAYDGFETSTGAFFDLVHALGETMALEETRDALAVVQVLLEDHEKVIVPLIESGLFGDALGDQYPEVDLAPGSELWDDLLQVATWMAEKPGLLEDLLRSFNDPASKRLGPIFAEMMRFKDVPQLNAQNENEPLDDVTWTVPVNRNQPDGPGNLSLFAQTISGIHELNGADLCNKQDARLVIGNFDVTTWLGWTGVVGPWDRCEVIHIENAARAFARAVIGREELVVQVDLIQRLVQAAQYLGLGGTIDTVLEVVSGIEGFGTKPTPQSLARLMYGTWNEFTTALIDPPTTLYGDVFRERYNGQMVLAWERVFRFCGDRILDKGETCPTTIQSVSLYDALSPLIRVLDDYDVDDGDPSTPHRFLFAELVSAFHTHYPTPANPMYQSTNPAGPRFVNADRAIDYEPLVADLLGDCKWLPRTGGGRTCNMANTGRLITRLSRVTQLLENMEVRPGVDGIAAAAPLLERILNPALSPGLANRAGATTTQTNSGTRTLPYNQTYLLLDALNRMDDAHATDADRNERWLSARSRLVDIFIKTQELDNDEYQFENRRLYAVLPILIDFFLGQMNDHIADGDLGEWARSFDDDLDDSLGGAMGTRTIRLFDAIHNHPETERALLELLRYLVTEDSPNDAFENFLFSSADSLYLLEDDVSLVTLIRAFADSLAADATSAVVGNGSADVESGILDQLIGLLSETVEVDTGRTLPTVLRNAVTHPAGAPETPIEVIADVIAEVNRATPNAGGPLEPHDYVEVMNQTADVLTDQDRGLERVYGIVQSRELGQ
ncbi:MAG: hypothetical protein H5U40_01760 [Polyangiaceae bacterium]|nr:hypothetical protein [Polyangiaceae bacterium]